ncbi:hypothetical protein FLA_1206 [Filimonas lacunae]|nr:hypothetical protein FLA_1206 [Filimonas lacunae]
MNTPGCTKTNCLYEKTNDVLRGKGGWFPTFYFTNIGNAFTQYEK